MWNKKHTQITSEGVLPNKSIVNPYEWVPMGALPKYFVSQDATFEVLQVLY